MSTDSMEERFSKLETSQKFAEASLSEQIKDSKDIKQTLLEIKIQLARMSMSQDYASSLEPRIRALEDLKNRAVGGGKVAYAICTGAGAIIGYLVHFLH